MSVDKELLVLCGPMRAGKSKELLSVVEKLKYSKTPYTIFKPDIDRHSEVVATRYKDISEKAVVINIHKPEDILTHLDLGSIKLPHVVLIDEAHFFNKTLFDVVSTLHSKGVNLVVAGLDLDANAKPFGPMGDIMSLATKVQKITAVCERCREDSTKTGITKKDPDFEKTNIKISDSDFYISLCTKCYYENREKNK